MPAALVSLSEALEWLESHWHENRAAPSRLHDGHTTDGALGGLRYSPNFASVIGSRPRDTVADERTAQCYHPMLRIAVNLRNCPECHGSGLKTVKTDRYRYPMWRALLGLQNALRPRRQPHPYTLILDLAAHNWNARLAAHSKDLPWNLAESLYLRAIRQLHGRYEQGPVGRVSWVDRSDSQRAAEVSAA